MSGTKHETNARESILEAAIHVASRDGLLAMTLDNVAREAGVSKGGLIYHFASKEQILVEGLTRFTDELLEEVRAGIPAKGDTNGIARLITNLAGWARRNRSFATVYFVNSVGLNPLVEARRRSTRIELIELLQQAARNVHGRLRPRRARRGSRRARRG